MISPIYQVLHLFGLPLSILFVLISIFQIYVSYTQRKGKKDMKYSIHACGFGISVCTLIVLIDPDGVYGRIPYLVDKIFSDTAGRLIEGGICLIVYSHFQAHYLCLNINMPDYIRNTFMGVIIFNFLNCYLGIALEFGLDRTIYCLLPMLQCFLFIFVILGVDFVAYSLVRDILVGQMKRDLELSSKRNTVIQQVGTVDIKNYHDSYIRLRLFHTSVVLIAMGFFIADIFVLFDVLKAGVHAPVFIPARHPEMFGLNASAFCILFLVVWIFYTWWAWVPYRMGEGETPGGGNAGAGSKTSLKEIQLSPTQEKLKGEAQFEVELGVRGSPDLPPTPSAEVIAWNPPPESSPFDGGGGGGGDIERGESGER